MNVLQSLNIKKLKICTIIIKSINLSNLKQQLLYFNFRKRFPSQLSPGYNTSQTSTFRRRRSDIYSSSSLLIKHTVTEFILYDHTIVFSPRRIVTNDVRVRAEDGVSAHFTKHGSSKKLVFYWMKIDECLSYSSAIGFLDLFNA